MFSSADNFDMGSLAKRPRFDEYSAQISYNYIYNQQFCNFVTPNAPVQQQIHQPSTNFWLTSEKMKEYLKDEKNLECVLSFSFPKVFKKSYTNENRFIILPPTIALEGFGWNKFIDGQSSASKNINIRMEICGTKKTNQSFMDTIEINDPKTLAQFQTRKLCITSDEQKNMCRLSADLHLPNGSAIKSIQSGRIKVMSKCSKKTKVDTSTSGASSFIKNESYIALFIRGPGTVTRYLHCNSAGFSASLKQWSLFKIYLVDERTGENEFSYNSEEKYIYYQRNILLVDVVTEMSLPIMKIRKCEHTKNKVYKFENNFDEPVCPLHIISFEYVDPNGNVLYLGTQNNVGIGWKSLTDPSKGINNEVKWNIISADRYFYRFYPINGLERITMLNFPIVLTINKAKIGNEWLEFEGRGLTNDIQVWFNTYPSPQTIYRSSSTIACIVPTLASYYKHCSTFGITETLTIPLYLVTSDGTIFPMSFVFVYNAKEVGEIGHVKFVHEIDRNTIEQPVNCIKY
uniref:Uncharacterized protein n=1 Tax=Panagrolaimus sp. PS1159 TaxID=55785 RepID=A0AC35GGH9_9BILA